MMGYLLRRLLSFAATLLGAAIVIFLVLEILPGDPAAVTLGLNAAPEALAALRAEMGLDQPALLRFFNWIGGLATGDLGLSYTYRVPVTQLIGERMVVTLPLASMAILLASAIGIPLGALAAANHNRAGDAAVMVFAQAGLAIPNFWFGLLLVLVFAVGAGWLPAGGFPGWQAGFWPALRSLLLPAVALASATSGDPRPCHPLGHAGDDAGGLRPHRPGQGGEPAAHHAAACPAQRSHPGRHRAGPAILGAAGRRDHH
jgi:peptide/nickel transport system permease protein